MHQRHEKIAIETRGAGLYEVSDLIRRFVGESGITSGIVTVFCPHTSCSLLLQENADPDVKTDLMAFFKRLVPEGMDFFVHNDEGPDDMPAHIKTALTQSSVGIPIAGSRPMFGTWQGLYLFEHRARPHRRTLVLHVIGE